MFTFWLTSASSTVLLLTITTTALLVVWHALCPAKPVLGILLLPAPAAFLTTPCWEASAHLLALPCTTPTPPPVWAASRPASLVLLLYSASAVWLTTP